MLGGRRLKVKSPGIRYVHDQGSENSFSADCEAGSAKQKKGKERNQVSQTLPPPRGPGTNRVVRMAASITALSSALRGLS